MKGKIEEKMRLRTLSPVHIGTGNEIDKTEYLLEGNTLTVYSLDKLISLLNERELNELIFILERNQKTSFHLIRKRLNVIKKYHLQIFTGVRGFNGKIKEFTKFIENREYKPYIPASELKGAIRTAILYKVLKDNWNSLKYKILEQKENRLILKDKSAKSLEREIFSIKRNRVEVDVLKTISIDDSYPEGNINLVVKEVELFNSRRKANDFVECLNSNSIFISKIDIYENMLNENLFKDYKYKNYILDWKNCCYEYAKDLIEVEKEYWINKNRDIYNFLEKIEIENTKDEPLIRIGRYTGKLSHTILVLLKIKKLDKYVNRYIFPKTRRITSNNEVLGWIKIEKFSKNDIDKRKEKTLTKDEIKKMLSKKYKVR